MNLQSLKEATILGSFFIIVFLPARLIFYEYVTDFWLGSAGLLSAILILVYVLSAKNKFGYIGRIFMKKLSRVKKSKNVKYLLMFDLLIILLLSVFLSAINYANIESSIYTEALNENLESNNITTVEELHDYSVHLELSLEDRLTNIFFVFLLPFVNFEAFASLAHVSDSLSAGWLSHFSLVMFIEFCESFAVLVYFKYVKKQPSKSSHDPLEK